MKLIHRRDEYCSHQPVLVEMVNNHIKWGPILEIGCGRGSTGLLHKLCRNRFPLCTVDDNDAFLIRYECKLADDYKFHIFALMDLDDVLKTDWIVETLWEMVFLDQGDWAHRAECLMFFKDRVKYIVLHDSYYYPLHGYFGKVIEPLVEHEKEAVCSYDDVFKYWKEFYPVKPWNSPYGIMTLVGSNTDPVPEHVDMEIMEI